MSARFCSTACRFADVRARRAAARADLMAALGQLPEVTRRVELTRMKAHMMCLTCHVQRLAGPVGCRKCHELPAAHAQQSW